MKISKEKAELIGAIIGDGFLHQHKNSRRIGLVGSPQTDREYFEVIKDLIRKVWDKEVKIVERERGLRITFGSKLVFNELIDLGIPKGKEKCSKVTIPKVIREDWNLARHTIRGITDTDGSVFTSNKPGSPNYPSIEITTSSNNLAVQLKELLEEQGFRVGKIWSYKSKLSKLRTYKVGLNGKKNVKMWLKQISFSNPYKLKRAKSYIVSNLTPSASSD
jgi:intein/homing endonuclease